MTELPADLNVLPAGATELVQRAHRSLYPHLLKASLVASESGLLPLGIRHLLGTEIVGEDPADTFEKRSGRCFELSAYAIAYGTAPTKANLVHGSMHGPFEGNQRISHAWLVLPGDLVWEPYSACVYDKDAWYKSSRAWDEVSYTQMQARINILALRNFGAWHTGQRYPVNNEDES